MDGGRTTSVYPAVGTTPPLLPQQPSQRRERDDAAEEAVEDDESRNKRQRTALACNSCRNRKSRCDGARPSCTACAAMGFACVYRRPVGPAASQQSPSEPLRFVQMESRLQMVEALVRQMARAADGHGAASDDIPNPAAPSVGLHLPVAELDSVDGMGTITFAGEAVSHYFGLSSNSAFAAQISRAVKATHCAPPADQAPATNTSSGDAPDEITSVNPPRGRAEGTLRMTMLSRPASPFGRRERQPRKTSDLLHLPPGNEMLRLVQAYFAHAGGYFPFVDKATLVRLVQELDFAVVSNVRRPFLCLLNAVLACGLSLTLTDSQDVKADEVQAAVYFDRAFALSPWVTSNTANLETVQGLAVMTQYAEGTSSSALTWRLHGLLMQAAVNIGLHVEDGTAAPDIAPLERETRRRTWYMCLVLDRMLSSTLGRPPLLHESVARVPLPSEGEALDHASPSQSHSQIMGQNPSFCELFVESIQLFRLLGDVVTELYHQNRASNHCLSVEGLLTGVVKLDLRFHDWQTRLSPKLKLVRVGESVVFAERPFNGARVVLTLRFLSAQLLLYRVIMSEYLHHVATGTRPDLPASLDAVSQTYISLCAELGKEIIDLITDAEEISAPLPSWWFVLYYLFQAALVMFGTVVFSNSSIARPGLCQFDVVLQLQKAARTVEAVAKDTVLARRCSKYLAAVIQGVQALETPAFQLEANGFADDVDRALSQDFPVNHLAFGNLSNFDLDGGLFLGDSNLQFLNHFGVASEGPSY